MNIKTFTAHLVDVTSRPDRASIIKSAIRQTVKELHSAALFSRDLVNDPITLDNPSYPVGFNLPPNFRRLLSVQPIDQNGQIVRVPDTHNGALRLLEPAELAFNSRNPYRNYAYIGGSTIVASTTTGVNRFLISYYKFPDVNDDYLETWLMTAEEDTVQQGALAKFYGDDQNQSLSAYYERQYQAAKLRIASEYAGAGV